MYSLEVWYGQSCRVIGAAGNPDEARKKAESLTDGSLEWVEVQPGMWEAAGPKHSRYVIIERLQG